MRDGDENLQWVCKTQSSIITALCHVSVGVIVRRYGGGGEGGS
jgi:hypothetical protein